MKTFGKRRVWRRLAPGRRGALLARRATVPIVHK